MKTATGHLGHVRLLLAALAAAFAFGGLVQVAMADHWHEVNWVRHAFVHGSDTRDGSFFGRTDSSWIGTNYCAVGDVDRGRYGDKVTYNADICSVWSHIYGSPDECRGWGYADQSGGKISGHFHYSHYFSNTSCRKSFV